MTDNNVYDNVILQDGAIIYGSPLVVSGEYLLGRGWVSSDLTGEADLIKTAHWGTVYLTGSNSYTGSTVIRQGTLSIGDRDSGVAGSGERDVDDQQRRAKRLHGQYHRHREPC